MSSSNLASSAKLSRRQSLQLGAATTAAGLLASPKLTPSAQAQVVPAGPFTTPWMVPLPVYAAKLPVAALSPAPRASAFTLGGECGRAPHQRAAEFPSQELYSMTIEPGQHSYHPELPTQTIWGYDGIVPGPTFVARYGKPITVRITNKVPANTIGYGSPEFSTHLHNLHCASESDGFTGDFYSSTKWGPTLTGPGFYKDHHYVNAYAGFDDPAYAATKGDPREALGTLWYHDHRMDFTGPNVYRGLHGFYLLFDDLDSGNENDPNPAALRLPSGVGKYDIPLLFHDKMFDSGGYVGFNQFEADGILGNKFCVNGKIQPFFNVERRKYRFRLLDGGPARFYEFYLTSSLGVNQPFTYIANDGNLLPAPLTMKNVQLGVAERADIVIDFSRYLPGTKLYLVNRLVQTSGQGPDAAANPRDINGLLTDPGVQIMRFDIGGLPPVRDNSRVPASLRALPPMTQADIDAVLADPARNRKFQFNKTNNVWTVNGNVFDVNTPAATVKRGSSEIWTLRGSGGWSHPVHIHFEEGRILSRNGQPPAPHEAGRKDVYVLGPGDEVVVFLRFREFLGKYMMHCHNLTHEDHAMMVRFDIVA
jgi:FtsP/CotA-like multicopper oxidase with cupredoxin domain